MPDEVAEQVGDKCDSVVGTDPAVMADPSLPQEESSFIQETNVNLGKPYLPM